MAAEPADISTYEPTPKQQLFHQCPAKFRLVLGAYGAGKTTLAVWEDIMLAMEYPGSLGVVFRKTYPALRDTTQRQYLEHIPPELREACRFVRTEGREAVEWPNGSQTLFRCLDDFMKQGSSQYDRVFIDEAWEVGEQEFRALALGRLRGKVGPRRMVCVTNPPDDTHWLYQFFVTEADDDKAVFKFSTYDNREHLPAGYIERMERSMTEPEKRKFLRGEWGILAKGKAVFGMFREDLHVGAFQPAKGAVTIRGWDFGFVHPACVWLQTDAMGYTYILHEILGDQEHVAQFAQRVVNDSHRLFPDCRFEDYCDVAGTQRNDRGPTAVHILRNQFKIFPHYRKVGRHKSIEGIANLLSSLANGGLPMLRIDRRCKYTVKALAGGYYLGTNGEPTGDNVYDHLIDALRYALAPAVMPMASPFEGKPLPRSWRAA